MNAREFFGALAAVALLAVIFWPWALGALDAGWWIATGHQFSSLPWGSGRGVIAFLWPVFALGIAAFFID